MKYVVTILLFAAALSISGCATIAGDKNNPGLGTHKIEIKEDGTVDINSKTLRGGPDVLITREDGTKIVIRSNKSALMKAFMESLYGIDGISF